VLGLQFINDIEDIESAALENAVLEIAALEAEAASSEAHKNEPLRHLWNIPTRTDK
jgi:hypothetical protein